MSCFAGEGGGRLRTSDFFPLPLACARELWQEGIEVLINLTLHPATPEQQAQGLSDLPDREAIRDLLYFESPPTREEILRRAESLAAWAHSHGATRVLIGGALFLMASLEQVLRRRGITPVYSFTRREATEVIQPDGSVLKTAVFRHLAWVEPPENSS
jgi:hypothetical protein